MSGYAKKQGKNVREGGKVRGNVLHSSLWAAIRSLVVLLHCGKIIPENKDRTTIEKMKSSVN